MLVNQMIDMALKRIHNNIDVMAAYAKMRVHKESEQARAHIYGMTTFYIKSTAQQHRWHRYHQFIQK